LLATVLGRAYGLGMDQTPTPPPRDPAAERRAKLLGRAMIIGMLLLAALYFVPSFLR
jgi:hypothetical protein